MNILFSRSGKCGMANKDDLISDDILRQGFLIKRSQNKKRFSTSNNNYKQRWFVLTTKHLIYYDTDSEDVLGGTNGTGMTNLHCLLGIHLLINRRKKERGRIPLESISVVERANISPDGGQGLDDSNLDTNNLLNGSTVGGQTAGFSIQIWYTTPGGQDVILYLITPIEQERQDWLLALRNAVSDNTCLASWYHRGLWNGKRWLCCKSSSKLSQGCEACHSPATLVSGTANSLNASFTSLRSANFITGGITVTTPGPAVASPVVTLEIGVAGDEGKAATHSGSVLMTLRQLSMLPALWSWLWLSCVPYSLLGVFYYENSTRNIVDGV
ncbi:hypothetical protein M8J76_014725 [Diaphorina citri]|nr:hypothetical protein M8J75_013218 [Diaphorina citri]KAI5733687.1 hypothetical protein M8J76_014725 [Diaphorina citri]